MKQKNKCFFFFIYSVWSPGAKLVNQVGFHIFPVTGIVCEQKPQSFYTDVMDGASPVAAMVSALFCRLQTRIAVACHT